jgi:hypothetical protein
MLTSSPSAPRRAHRWRTRLLAAAIGAAAATTLVAAPVAAAPTPTRISGDHHSPTVVALATAALADHDLFSVNG